MKIYSFLDSQFDLFSDPFLAPDDVSARHLIVQTALSSESFRFCLRRSTLYLLGDFDPSLPDPISLTDHPLRVATGEDLLSFVADSSKSLFRGGSV